jgi:hypothetical protein
LRLFILTTHVGVADNVDFNLNERHVLCSKEFSGVEARLNLGLDIVGNPREAGSQDDIYKYCTAVIFPVFPMVQMFISDNSLQ